MSAGPAPVRGSDPVPQRLGVHPEISGDRLDCRSRWAILKGIERHTGEPLGDFATALEAAHLADPHPDTAGMSAHMLLIATVG
ncbi:hypothetical protein [Streptomyces sp. NPDC006510]|uniref:hypothetical protein n=1 Tax=Streptomyces sp. NPDC006510 TaxID=3155600 RepID=UPI0033A71524